MMNYRDLIFVLSMSLPVIVAVNTIQSNNLFKEDIVNNCKLKINEAEAKIRSLERDLIMAELECDMRRINAIK